MHPRLALLGVVFLVGMSRPEITEEEDVLVLTSENFQEAINANKFVLVEFYAPWCGHCKALAPEYAEAARLLKEEKSEIKLAKVEATENRDLASKYGIGGYPTLKFFKSGEPMPYKGARKTEGILEWVKKKSGPVAITLYSTAEAKKFIADNEVAIVGFFLDINSTPAKHFLKAAEELDDYNYVFGITQAQNKDVFASYDIEDDAIVLFKAFDEGRNDFQNKGKSFKIEEIKNFIIPHSLPLVIDFHPKLAARIYGTKLGAIFLFLSSESDDFSSHREVASKIAKEYKGRTLTVIIDSEKPENGRFFDLLGMPEDDVPGMRFAIGWSLKYAPETAGITEDEIKKFIDDTLGGKTKAITWSKSEEIPEDWDEESVKVLVGKNFHDVVTKSKNVFVEFYAPWCGHCKALTPIWEELADKFKDREDVMIAKMDATVNVMDSVRVPSYPTLILFSRGTNAQVKFQEKRTLEDLLDFLEEQGINQSGIKKAKDNNEEKDEL